MAADNNRKDDQRRICKALWACLCGAASWIRYAADMLRDSYTLTLRLLMKKQRRRRSHRRMCVQRLCDHIMMPVCFGASVDACPVLASCTWQFGPAPVTPGANRCMQQCRACTGPLQMRMPRCLASRGMAVAAMFATRPWVQLLRAGGLRGIYIGDRSVASCESCGGQR
jgi:hypothetical protein